MFVAPHGRCRGRAALALLAACALGAAACGGSRSSGTGGKGGAGTGAQIGGGGRGGGAAGLAGGAGMGTGGTSVLPADAGVDAVGDAGAPGLAGAGGGAAGAGGAAAGGTAGDGASGGGPGGSGGIAGVEGTGATAGTGGATPLPSPGCAMANARPSEQIFDNTLGLEIRRRFPSTYEGVTPMPLIFALHATNYSASGMIGYLIRDQPMADRYVIVAPQERALGGPANFESRKVADFSTLLTSALNELCIDQRRVFGAGNGSGGRTLIKWRSTSSAQVGIPPLRATAMVGTYIVSFQVPLPIIFIHPLTHTNSGAIGDADGSKAITSFRTRNGCSESSVPVSADTCSGAVNPGCVDFDGCMQPLRFCHHDDLTGQSGGDPWSCVATPAIYQFFSLFL